MRGYRIVEDEAQALIIMNLSVLWLLVLHCNCEPNNQVSKSIHSRLHLTFNPILFKLTAQIAQVAPRTNKNSKLKTFKMTNQNKTTNRK